MRQCEAEGLRTEIIALTSESRQLEIIIAGAVAVTYGWLATDGRTVAGWIWWLPPTMSILGSIRAFHLNQWIMLIAEYTRRIEEREFSGDQELPGWEHFISEQRNRKRHMRLGYTSVLFWCALILTTLFVAWNHL